MASEGKKFTSGPETKDNPIVEGTGLVTSDSLAAESVKQGGAFAQNPKADVSAQPSKSTTSNVTDTSNVAELPPARDAQSRPEAGLDSGSQSGVNKIAERAGQQKGQEHVDPQSAVGEHGDTVDTSAKNHAAGTTGETDGQDENASTWKEFHADPHSTVGEQGGTASGNGDEAATEGGTEGGAAPTGAGRVGTNTSREGFTSETHTTIADTGTRRVHGKQHEGGEEVEKLIQERQANLELPEQPPQASDWNSADERKVNLGVD